MRRIRPGSPGGNRSKRTGHEPEFSALPQHLTLNLGANKDLSQDVKHAWACVAQEEWRGGTLQADLDGGTRYDEVISVTASLRRNPEGWEYVEVAICTGRREFHPSAGEPRPELTEEPRVLFTKEAPTLLFNGWKLPRKDMYLLHSGIPQLVEVAA